MVFLATNWPAAASPIVSRAAAQLFPAEPGANAGYLQSSQPERGGVHSQRSFGVAMPRSPRPGQAPADLRHGGECPIAPDCAPRRCAAIWAAIAGARAAA